MFVRRAAAAIPTALKRNLIVVHVVLLAGSEDAFKKECIVNGNESLKEKGIARFDIVQDRNDQRHFRLCEVYYCEEAMKAHRETPHFQRFNKMCDELLVEPRTRFVFDSICPVDDLWIVDKAKL
ncbi:Antibiotic biosynthesis monooxygenase [Blastocystis sp. ATCC 50177/Nand II]|uniref:Antibiotic biosynthesis monooxygenase n=1 Tax=Blastocystis sp. subtype 1 (strain ATCC 50177 / NandII) TaxID=478820 RepID=A0A196S9K3_BLAHN|nr:Antibiotic biosynthesis monooxygenase [Blastocystis sp. ATCC 50177/Nand II]